MSSHRLFAFVVLFVSAGLMFFTTAQLRADIIYQLVNYPLDQGGHTLSGTITTDGFMGELGSAGWPDGYHNYNTVYGGHIKSATFQIDDGTLYNVTYIPNTWYTKLIADSTRILLYSAGGSNAFALDYNQPSVGVWGIEWGNSPTDKHYYGSNPSLGSAWQTVNPPATAGHIAANNPWVIAMVVPEPATLVLLFTALLGLGWSYFLRKP